MRHWFLSLVYPVGLTKSLKKGALYTIYHSDRFYLSLLEKGSSKPHDQVDKGFLQMEYKKTMLISGSPNPPVLLLSQKQISSALQGRS